jgi:hypothetical protein
LSQTAAGFAFLIEMRASTAIVSLSVVLITEAASAVASAQPSNEAAGRVSFNVGVSTARVDVGPTSTVVSPGADVNISHRWGLRAEIGKRWPIRRVFIFHSDYGSAPVVDGVTVVEDTSLFDLAILMRARWPMRQRFEVAALLGPDVRYFRSHSTLTVPWKDRAPSVSEQRRLQLQDLLDVGLEVGTRLNERLVLQVYALAGFSSPFADGDTTSQLRAGAMLQFPF